MNTQEISNSESGVFGLKLTVMTLDIDPSSKPITQVFYKNELTLGRLPSNDVVLGRPEISGIHARLRIEKGLNGETDKLFITDLGSSNGTTVEKNQLRPRIEIAMMPNERIFIGNYVIKPTIISPESNSQNNNSFLDLNKSEETSYDNSTTTIRRNLLSEAVKEFENSIESNEKSSVDSYTGSLNESDLLELNLNDSSSLSSNQENQTSPLKVQFDESFIERNKTMEFKPPFGSPISEEEENLRVRKVDENIGSKEAYTKTNGYILTEANSNNSKDFKNNESLSYNVTDDLNESETKEHIVEYNINELEVVNKKEAHLDMPSWISKEENSKISNNESIQSPKIESSILSHSKPEIEKISDFKNFETKKELDAPISDTSGLPLSIKIKVDGADVRSINFVARAFTDLKGSIKHKGLPLPGVLIDGGSLGTTITQSDGSFIFSKILEGTDYSLKLSKEKFSFSSATISGKVGKDTPAETVNATELFTISGVITHQGVPLSGVEVDGGELGKVYTKVDGSYLFENVPEGKEYNLTLHKEGYVFKS